MISDLTFEQKSLLMATLSSIAYNDDYDGYVIQKLPSTTFNDVTDLLNVFILSRLVNLSFIQLLIPISDDPNEGGDDPSVQAFFQNRRWDETGGAGNLVGNLIDGDYAQMVSINSEYGVFPYSLMPLIKLLMYNILSSFVTRYFNSSA